MPIIAPATMDSHVNPGIAGVARGFVEIEEKTVVMKPDVDGAADEADVAEVTDVADATCNLIPVSILWGDSAIPVASTLQYSRVLFMPFVVMRGWPSVATLSTGPPLIL